MTQPPEVRIGFRNLTPEQFAEALREELRKNPPPTEYDLMMQRAEHNRRIAELMKLEITI